MFKYYTYIYQPQLQEVNELTENLFLHNSLIPCNANFDTHHNSTAKSYAKFHGNHFVESR